MGFEPHLVPRQQVDRQQIDRIGHYGAKTEDDDLFLDPQQDAACRHYKPAAEIYRTQSQQESATI